jgi:hypothetical protein
LEATRPNINANEELFSVWIIFSSGLEAKLRVSYCGYYLHSLENSSQFWRALEIYVLRGAKLRQGIL